MNNGDHHAGFNPSMSLNSSDTTTQNSVTDLSASSMLKMRDLFAEAINSFDVQTLQVRHNQLNDKIGLNSDAIYDLSNRLSTIEKENSCLKQELANKDKKISSLQSDIKKNSDIASQRHLSQSKINNHSLFQHNQREQRQRLRTLRVVNFQLPNSSEPVDSDVIYDTLFKPILEEAYANKKLRYIPDHKDVCIEKSHPLKAKKNAVPVYLFAFYSRSVLEVILDSKKGVLARLNKEAVLPDNPSYAATTKHGHLAAKSIRISRDLTWLNRKTMTTLYKNPAIRACKLQGLGVSFKLVHGSDKWFSVSNPFGATIPEMTAPIPTLPMILGERFPNPLILDDDEPQSEDESDPSPTEALPTATSNQDVVLPAVGVVFNTTIAAPTATTPAIAAAEATTDAPATEAATTSDGTTATDTSDADAIDPELRDSATALARAILEARPAKRPAQGSPDLKPANKKTSQPPLSPIERMALRKNKNNKKK